MKRLDTKTSDLIAEAYKRAVIIKIPEAGVGFDFTIFTPEEKKIFPDEFRRDNVVCRVEVYDLVNGYRDSRAYGFYVMKDGSIKEGSIVNLRALTDFEKLPSSDATNGGDLR